MSRLFRNQAARCAAIVTNSKSVAEEVKSFCPNGVRVYPIYNGIDLERFSPLGPTLDLDALSGMPKAESGTVRVGLLSTFARWKGHEVFLKAISFLPSSLAIRGYVIGGALYQTEGSQCSLGELKSLAARLGVSNKVGFTGFVENPEQAIRALDIVAHASTEPEPFGLVIAEAMACARAVIVSQAGGVTEFVAPGVNALTYPPGAPHALADCIARLATHRDLRENLGSKGRASAERLFDRNRFASDLIPIYEGMTSKEAASPSPLDARPAHP